MTVSDLLAEIKADKPEKVLHFIQTTPGCHLRQIKKELKLPMGTIQYNLLQLEKIGKITSIRRGLYRFYFPYRIFQDNEKAILQILSQETAREILMLIIERKNPTQKDIANTIGISAASVNWHIKRLIASKIIDEVKTGKYKKYILHDDISPKDIVALLKNYYPSIWSKWSSGLAETFLFLSANKKENENHK
jgi:predicted transcriptional regulator